MYCDGASRDNPGESGAGAFLVNEKGDEHSLTKYLGLRTNNQAEYEALILGLEKLKNLKAKEVEVRSDSQLMVRQLNGEYRIKHEGLKGLYLKARRLIESFEQITVHHIPREENKIADRLSNDAIDLR